MKSPKSLKAVTMALIMAGLAAVIVENAAAADGGLAPPEPPRLLEQRRPSRMSDSPVISLPLWTSVV